MKKSLLVIPAVLVASFICFERPAARQRNAAEQAHTAALAQARLEAETRRAEALAAATAESNRRNAERDAQERAKAEARQRAHEEKLAALDQKTAAHLAEIKNLTATLATLTQELAEARDLADSVQRDTFDLTKQLEKQRVDRRSIEFDVQRATAMVTRRMADTSP